MLMQVYELLLIQVLYYTTIRHCLTSELIHEQLIRRSQCLASVCHTHEEVPVNITLYYFLFVVNYPYTMYIVSNYFTLNEKQYFKVIDHSSFKRDRITIDNDVTHVVIPLEENLAI